MMRVIRWTDVTLAALLLLYAILIGGTRLIQAEPTAEEQPTGKAASAAAPEHLSPAPSSAAASAPSKPKESSGQPSSPSAAKKDEMKRWRDRAWQIAIGLDAPSLVPQAVLCALFDKDPVATFTGRVKEKMQSSSGGQLEWNNEVWRQKFRDIDMVVSWNAGFRETTGDNIWLLTSHPDAGISPVIVSSAAPAATRWIVTKTVSIDGTPVCWCVPVEVELGQRITVILSESNIFDLRKAYAQARGEPAVVGEKAAKSGPQAKSNGR